MNGTATVNKVRGRHQGYHPGAFTRLGCAARKSIVPDESIHSLTMLRLGRREGSRAVFTGRMECHEACIRVLRKGISADVA